jgi:hypothetical protein
MVKFVAFVVLGWLVFATAMSTVPAEMTRTGGDVPAQESFRHGCAFDEPGLENCTDTASYLWRLPGAGAVTTTWKPSRADVDTVTGKLTHEHADCPDSRVEWTVVAEGSTSGTLTADAPTTRLEIPVGQPLHEITLTVRRLDTATCASAPRWTDPRLEPPFKLFP